MNYQAVIKEIPAFTVYSARYTMLNEIMPALGEKVGKANPGLKCVEPGYCFNVYLDGEYRDTDINIGSDFQNTGNIPSFLSLLCALATLFVHYQGF